MRAQPSHTAGTASISQLHSIFIRFVSANQDRYAQRKPAKTKEVKAHMLNQIRYKMVLVHLGRLYWWAAQRTTTYMAGPCDCSYLRGQCVGKMFWSFLLLCMARWCWFVRYDENACAGAHLGQVIPYVLFSIK